MKRFLKSYRFADPVPHLCLVGLLILTVSGTPAQEINDPTKPDNYDLFMLDDSPATLNEVTATEKQTHNFHKPDDKDWIKILVDSPAPYTITVKNIGGSCDTKILLHEWSTTSYHLGIKLLQEMDNAPAGAGETETLSISLEAKTYYLLIENVSEEPIFAPSDMLYEVEIARNLADEGSVETIPLLYSIIDSSGGTVPELVSDGRPAGVLQPGRTIYYDQVLLTVPPGTLYFPTKVLISGAEELDAEPDSEITAKWQVGDRKDNASIVHVRVYQDTETFDPPLKLRLQLLNDVLLDGWLFVDDIPAGFPIENTEIWTWDGSDWVVFDPDPAIVGMTAETDRISHLTLQRHSGQNYVEGYFAAAPRAGTGVNSWQLY